VRLGLAAERRRALRSTMGIVNRADDRRLKTTLVDIVPSNAWTCRTRFDLAAR